MFFSRLVGVCVSLLSECHVTDRRSLFTPERRLKLSKHIIGHIVTLSRDEGDTRKDTMGRRKLLWMFAPSDKEDTIARGARYDHVFFMQRLQLIGRTDFCDLAVL